MADGRADLTPATARRWMAVLIVMVTMINVVYLLRFSTPPHSSHDGFTLIPQLEKRTPYVALASNIATLLGLLGTIMGLIEAFTAVANANPAEKADLLSASISVAMNTTAFGLIVAIPLLVTNTVLMAKTSEIIDSLEMASVKALNVISSNAKRRLEA